MTKNHTIIRITSVLSIRIRKLNQLNQFMYEGNTSRKELGWIQKQQDARSKNQQMLDQRPYLFVLVSQQGVLAQI